MTDVERALREIARTEPWPPTPDIAPAVGHALRVQPAGRARLRRPERRRRTLAVVVAAAVILPAGAALAFPDARDEVLEWLGLRSVEVRRTPEPPQGREPEPRLDFGRRVSLPRAGGLIGFEPLVPAALGRPDEVRVQGRRLSLIYRRRAGRRLLVTEQRGTDVVTEKLVGPGTSVRAVSVGGARGAWITGSPHVIVFRDARGQIRDDELLLAGDTLVWERDGLVHRIEGARSLAHALRIARSLA